MSLNRTQRGILVGALWGAVTLLNVLLLPPRYLLPVRTTILRKAVFPLIVRAPGALQPKRSLTIKADFDGRILLKGYQEGKRVEQNQLLLEISREKIQPDFDSKDNAVKNARSDLEKARKDVKVQRALFKKQAVALSAVEEAERTVVKSVQALQSAQSAFRLEMERWNKNKIRAPFGGTIIKDSLEEERDVSAGKEVFTLADISEYSLKARVDELEIGQVKIGQSADVRIQAYEQKPLKAHVVRLGSQAEGSSLPEIPVFLQLDSLEGIPLLPKLTAEARIRVGELSDALFIPLTAIENADGKPKVWGVTSSQRLQLRPVTLGRSNPEQVVVQQGLQEGERIVAVSDPRYREGMKISPME